MVTDMSAQKEEKFRRRANSQLQAEHRYVRCGRYSRAKSEYLSLEMSPFILLYRLYWYGKPLGIRGRGIRRKLGDCRRLIHMMRILFYYRRHAPGPNDLLVLPVPGDLCRQVQKGYKVFDFRRKVVIKVFKPSIDPASVRREIANVRRVGAHCFAPTVHSWDVEARWYEEDYVDAYRVARPSLAVFLDTFHVSVPPLLVPVLLAFPPEVRRSIEYVEELIRLNLSKLGEPTVQDLDTVKVTKIKRFFDQTMDRLRLEGDRPIYLGWSHGDFSTHHVLMANHGSGPVLIDWERSGYRSVMYDLYDAFFKRLRQVGRADPEMVVTMKKAISQFRSHLVLHTSADCHALIASLDTAELYRCIYSIEKVCKSIGRNMTDRKLERIMTYLNVYTCYEQRLLEDIDHKDAVSRQKLN